jgi:DNA mismatch repair ATPase MutL
MKVRMINRGSVGNIKMMGLKRFQNQGSTSNLFGTQASYLKYDKARIQQLASKLEPAADLQTYNAVISDLVAHLQAENASREDANGADPMIKLIEQLRKCSNHFGKKPEGPAAVNLKQRGETA